MCGRFDYFLDAFAGLQETRSPEKGGKAASAQASQAAALLLVAVLDCIEKRMIVRNFVSPTAALEHLFHGYCNLIMPPGQQVPLAAPFCQLECTGFWELKPQPGKSMEKMVCNLDLPELRRHYFGAKFSDDLYPLLQMTTFRGKLRQVLIESHFSHSEQRQLKGQFSRDSSVWEHQFVE